MTEDFTGTRWRGRLLWAGAGFLLAAVFFLVPRPGPTPDAPAEPSAAPVGAAPGETAETPGAASRVAARAEPARHLGVVLSSEAVDVAAEVEGRVEAIHVRSGDAVERSQRVATLDTRELRQELRIGEADLASAEAKVRQIALEVERSSHERQRRLALEGLVSKEEAESSRFALADAEARLEVARAERDQVRARIEQLESNLRRSEIRAPFAGEVALRYVDSGAVVSAGTPVVRLISSSGLLVRFAVPPDQAVDLAAGTAVRIELETLDEAVAGSVSQISPEIDSASHMVFVEAHVAASAAGRIPAGSVARVVVDRP